MKFFPNSPVKSQFELLLTVKRDAEVLVRLLCNAPAARGTGEESLLQKVGFVDILERNGFLVDRGGERFHADRTAGIKLDDAAEHAPVERVEPEMVDPAG